MRMMGADVVDVTDEVGTLAPGRAQLWYVPQPADEHGHYPPAVELGVRFVDDDDQISTHFLTIEHFVAPHILREQRILVVIASVGTALDSAAAAGASSGWVAVARSSADQDQRYGYATAIAYHL